MQLSKAFMLWILGIKDQELFNHLVSTYLGNREYEGTDNWGDYYYVALRNTYSPELLARLRLNHMYAAELDYTPEHTMFVYKITPEIKAKIVKPFLEGKYSKIDRDYVKSNFNAYTDTGELSTNGKILHRDPSLKAYWEHRIGQDLPDEAEVWNKVKKEHEIYAYS